MDMLRYLGKKVDLVCTDGEKFAGYVFDVLSAEDSEIEADSVELAPLDREVVIVIPVDEIESVRVDSEYVEFDFRK